MWRAMVAAAIVCAVVAVATGLTAGTPGDKAFAAQAALFAVVNGMLGYWMYGREKTRD